MFIIVIFHCLSTNELSFNSFLTCKICSKCFRFAGILLVIFFGSSVLFSALTEVKWLSSLCIISLCLLPFQCSLLLDGSYRLFSLLMFLLYYCFNNVKSQVLAVIWRYCPFSSLVTFFLQLCFFSFFLSLVFWYFVLANAKLSISYKLQEKIAERK